MALYLGQSLQLVQNRLQALRFVQRLIGWHTARDQALGKALVELLRPYASSAINGEIPRNTNQPDTHVTYCQERATVLENANEDVLNDVLGLCSTPQD